MVEYKVLITTSGIGSRLGKLTNYTNKCLVRVGDIPAISHIIESYPKETNFVITLGHYGDYVKQFLELTYNHINFTFVYVDVYEGVGSSLGYSILKAKSELQCPFIFHASDTILPNLEIPDMSSNWCIGAYKSETSQYRTLKISGDKIDAINEKGEINFDYPYVGVCGIKDYDLFWGCLEKLDNNHSLSDVHVINKMLNVVEFKFYEADIWLDIGNTNELNNSRNYFGQTIDVLDKENESIFFFEEFVVKFFSDTIVNKNRVRRANLLNNLVPKILGSKSNFYKYEKVKGKLFSKSVNTKTFYEFLNWAKNSLWVGSNLESSIKFKNLCYDFYINKTIKRVNQYLDGKCDSIQIINGIEVQPIHAIINSLDVDWLTNGIPSQFHGDFILDNIIQTDDGYTLIDWRQDFGGDLELGDVYYDLAKLNHNLVVNHKIVSNGNFNSDIDDCYILCNSKLVECIDVFNKFISENGYDLKKVKILTGIIWINMAPLHEYPFNKFLFNYGKYILTKELQL
jgi:choline kinase